MVEVWRIGMCVTADSAEEAERFARRAFEADLPESAQWSSVVEQVAGDRWHVECHRPLQ